MNTDIPRPEYPRPDFEREQWLNLNGQWGFEFDDHNIGEQEKWYIGKDFSHKITVPFCYQSHLSGIYDQGFHTNLWYKREFIIPDSFKGRRIFLNFGAVDYRAKVWVNGQFVCKHTGGHVPFKTDISKFINEGKNVIVVKAEDPYECIQPRGKQYWKEKPDRCWYTPTSGIWQTVWLETTGDVSIDEIRMTPDIDKKQLMIQGVLDSFSEPMMLKIKVLYKGNMVNKLKVSLFDRIFKVTLDVKEEDYIDEVHYWTPESPNLYDIEFELLKEDMVVDRVKSYFGMRKISVKDDIILLNNRPYYQRLILDQGYWPESLLTPPSDDAIRYDIEMIKKMGFNGARKHQKIEDPRYYYWADRLGILVWGEMPSAYQFNNLEIDNVMREWSAFIGRDYNHPSIVVWVPLNESWGVRNIFIDKNQQNFARSLYYLTKALDGTRLVSTNDGWEQIDGDICAIHDYRAWGDDFKQKYEDKESILSGTANGGRMVYCQGERYEGQPIMITEYGGIAFDSENEENWGYNGTVKDEEGFVERYSSITSAIKDMHYIRGYCYTQLTDVMQEVNGLMTADRKPKVDVEKIAKINLSR